MEKEKVRNLFKGFTGNFEQNQAYSRQSTQSDAISLGGNDNKGTIGKKSYNIFSSAVRSGLESYILGKLYNYCLIKKVKVLIELKIIKI